LLDNYFRLGSTHWRGIWFLLIRDGFCLLLLLAFELYHASLGKVMPNDEVNTGKVVLEECTFRRPECSQALPLNAVSIIATSLTVNP
jgi:hypothetical protein